MSELQAAAVAALARLGGEVRVFSDADNCVRPRAPGEAVAPGDVSGVPIRVPSAADVTTPPDPPVPLAAPAAAALPFVIEVQGTPNLFHELAHVMLLGRLAKDHATDPAKIPFDLASDDGARLLFEELACCVASCAWHDGPLDAVRAWFDEQVDIQPCFFRRDGDLAAFLRDADAAIARAPDRYLATCERAIAGVAAALAAARGPSLPAASPPRLFAPRPFDPLAEWTALLERHRPRAT